MVDYSTSGTYPYEVVGVVGDVRFGGPRSEPKPEIYLPHAQRSYLILNVAVRTATGATSLPSPPSGVMIAPQIRDVLAAVDPQKPAHGIYPLAELVGATYVRERRAMHLLVGFAIIATLLSTLGVYGLLTYRVRQHSAEIGIRMALGADRRRLVGWVAGQAARLVAIGALLGLALATIGTRLLASLLFGVSRTDPGAALGVVAMLVLVAVAAAMAPAWRPPGRDLATAVSSGTFARGGRRVSLRPQTAEALSPSGAWACSPG